MHLLDKKWFNWQWRWTKWTLDDQFINEKLTNKNFPQQNVCSLTQIMIKQLWHVFSCQIGCKFNKLYILIEQQQNEIIIKKDVFEFKKKNDVLIQYSQGKRDVRTEDLRTKTVLLFFCLRNSLWNHFQRWKGWILERWKGWILERWKGWILGRWKGWI